MQEIGASLRAISKIRARERGWRYASAELERDGVRLAAEIRSMYRYTDDDQSVWMVWADPMRVVRSPGAQDVWNRVYWAGEGGPAVLKSVEGSAVAVASSSADATYQLVRIPSNCKVKEIKFESAAQTAGKFDLDDLRLQISQMQRMGGLGALAGMMPGMKGME